MRATSGRDKNDMNTIEEILSVDSGVCPELYQATIKQAAVSQMLEEACPSKQCSDVDRAILGASLGG